MEESQELQDPQEHRQRKPIFTVLLNAGLGAVAYFLYVIFTEGLKDAIIQFVLISICFGIFISIGFICMKTAKLFGQSAGTVVGVGLIFALFFAVLAWIVSNWGGY